MKTKSLLSFLAAWTLFLALTFFAGPSAPGLYAQDDDANEEKADEENPDGEKTDGGQKGPAAAVPAPSVGADPGIRGEADARISLFRTGQYGSLTQFKSDFPTAAAASTAAANVSSLTALNLDLTSINNVLSAAGKNLTDVFGSDYSGVGAIVSAGGSKQAALESAITTALATNNSNVSNSGFRRGIGDASADVQKDYALILSVVDFAKSVAAPDGEFVSEVGSASGAWDKISLEGLGATIQGIEKVTVDASDAGFDPDAVRADLGTQITATSALIVSELIESAPVTEKNAAGEIDYSNHLNGAVAQKLVIEEAIAEGSAKLTDLVKPASESVSILKTAVASAEAVSHVSKEIATTIAADVAAGNTPTKTAFDPKVAGKKVADVLFKKAEKVKVAAAANVAAGETFTFDSTVFSPAAGAKVAETVYDVAENLDAATELTFEATEALYDFAADFIADDASISATDVSALTLDATVLETIYVFADDVVADAGAGATIAAFDPEALEAVYTFAEDFKADAIAAGGTFDASTTFDAGKLEALEVMYEFAEDVAADAGANFDAGSAGAGGADYFNPEALEAMFDFAEDMHSDAIAGGQEFDASTAFADAGKLEALEVMYEFAEDVAADAGAGFEADFNPEALEAMFDFAEDMHKDAVAAGGTFEAGAMFAADAGKLEALEVMYEFAEDVAADAGAGFEADFDPEALEAMFDFAEDMHKDAVAAGGTFEASAMFAADAGKLEALEVIYEFAEDVAADAGAGFEANFDPEALETIFDFAEDMHKDAVAAGGTFEASTAFDASKLEAIEAVYEFAEDLSLEGGDTFEADFDPEALEALYLFADDQVKAGKAGGDAFDPEALEAVFHIADDAVDEAGFDPNVGFDLKAFDAVYDYADAEADKTGFDGGAGFDKHALEALYEFADQAVDDAGYDPNVGFDANAFDALYDMVDAQADQAGFDPNVGFDVRALDAVFEMADAQADGKVFDPNAMLGMYEMIDAKADSDTISVAAMGALLGQFEEDAQQAGFAGFDSNDLSDFGDMFDYAAKQGDPTLISDEDFDRMESWMDDQRSELAPGGDMPSFEQMEVVFNQIEDLAEGGNFDPDVMDTILALAQSGVGISQMDALDAMPQSTRDAFNNFQTSNPSEAGDLMASNPPLTNTELLLMLGMDPAQRTRLLAATSTDEAALSPTTPPLGEVLDQLRADMEERGLPIEASNIDGSFLEKSITLAEDAGANANAEIFEKIHDIADDLTMDPNLNFANPLIEAGQLANKLLIGVTIGPDQFTHPEGMDQQYQDRSRLLSSSYNIHVIRLLGKYAFPQQTTNLATKLTAFLEDNTVFSGTGQNIQNVRDLFDDQNKNTEVLGARNLGLDVPFGKIPRQDPDDYGVIGGKKVEIKGTGNLNLSTYLRKTPDLAIAGVEEVRVWTSFTVSGGQKPGTSAGLAITAPTVIIEEGDLNGKRGIAFDGLYLAIGADNDLNLKYVSLQNDKHLGLASLGNVTLNNCSLLGGHRGKVYVYAQETLTVDGVDLSSDLAEVYMEARTVNLSNINFPRDSDVFLKSELGAIDGKYPNFGTVEAGRVNFINNVKYDGQSIHDRASFDQHGDRIKVGIINSNP